MCSKWAADGLHWPGHGPTAAANVAVSEQISGGERQPESVGQNCRTGQIDEPVRQARPVDSEMNLIVLPLHFNLLIAGHLIDLPAAFERQS